MSPNKNSTKLPSHVLFQYCKSVPIEYTGTFALLRDALRTNLQQDIKFVSDTNQRLEN